MIRVNSYIEYNNINEETELNVKDLAEMFDNFVLDVIKWGGVSEPMDELAIARHRYSTTQNGFTETVLIDYENRSIKYFNQDGLNGKPVRGFRW